MMNKALLTRTLAFGACCLAALAFVGFFAGDRLRAQETVSANRPTASEHPLAHPMRILVSRQQQIERDIQDFTCVLVKRERIDGELQEQQQLFVKVRHEGAVERGLPQPYAVFLQYLRPQRLHDRRVLFVEGRHDDRLLIRKGGSRLSTVTVRIAPDSEAARRESLNPVTELGFDRMAASLLDRLKQDMQADPTGANTQVEYFEDAKLNKRPCLVIRVTHPQRQRGLEYHMAHVFIDEEHQLPVRVDAYDWPAAEGDDPPLLSEFTYMNLSLNVGLTEADFHPSVVSAEP